MGAYISLLANVVMVLYCVEVWSRMEEERSKRMRLEFALSRERNFK